ncbi:hypothetical protein [Flavisolibacter ginsengisoli]|jgi:hypothetical protein|uniref:Uncharacterized protein n=1 Tax=Flavisolibacter ginsengisoli DSM 18119 TaxID=1121884 RepID=A0A1M5AN82_9BACT|nr:hypothetical protein [Flavisolibacter ginsengisoli]SHF31584.1 hypothetical protein SAMN02745131_02287 [Flavisolibacter ginsengisoli DSM 18119]
MKRILSIALVTIIFSACTKNSKEVPIDPNNPYTIKFDVSDQVVKTTVDQDTLRLDFNQVVNFLVDPTEYQRSWALHLTQDFSNSYLKGLHFTALANSAGVATDWVPINLNDVHPSQKTTSETTVNGTKYIKVTITRLFKFVSVLNSNQAAIDKQNALVQDKNQSVAYSAFYSYNSVYSLPNNDVAKIVYTK